MQEIEAKLFIKENYNVEPKTLSKLDHFHKLLLNFNKKYNLISKKTEDEIWNRHFLDSVQLIDLIDTNLRPVIADFGTGAGFPGLIIKILDNNNKFHVKLYEKSPIKRRFLSIVKEKLKLKIDIEGDEYEIISQISSHLEYINTLIIEFHDINKEQNMSRIINFINSDKKIKQYLFNEETKDDFEIQDFLSY